MIQDLKEKTLEEKRQTDLAQSRSQFMEKYERPSIFISSCNTETSYEMNNLYSDLHIKILHSDFDIIIQTVHLFKL